MLLAIETSGVSGSVALWHDDCVVARSDLETEGRRHAQTLVADIDRLLKSAAIAARDLTAVAVSIGPGSFTGLRVGLTCAKTLAWLHEIPLLAVDTLRVVAQQAPVENPVVTACIDAQRGELFVASYELQGGADIRQALTVIRIVSATALPLDVPLIGPGLERHREQLELSHTLLAAAIGVPHAAAVAAIGNQMLIRGEVSDPDTLEPVYVRLSYAEEKRNPVSQAPTSG